MSASQLRTRKAYEPLSYEEAPYVPEYTLPDGSRSHEVPYGAAISPSVPNLNEKNWNNVPDTDKRGVRLTRGWVPVPLHLVFWIPLVTVMILLAVVLEIALYKSNQNSGWPTLADLIPETPLANYYHYAYTIPPVMVSMVIVALWAWVDIEIQKMQPYIDLVRGNASAEKSILLDYTRSNKFIVWMSAFSNRHYMVALIALVALVTLIFQPICASTFVVKDTWWGPDPFNVTSLASISLNEGLAFQDQTAFLLAAGYASSVLYNFGDLQFIQDVYTVAPFQIPSTNGGFNGTVSADTTSVKTESNCYPMATQSTQISGGGWTNNATVAGCTFSFSVGPNGSHVFGADVMPDCNNTGTSAYFLPIVLWFFTYDTTPQVSATFCAPTISLLDVTVTVDMNTGNLTSVLENGPLNSSTYPLSQNLTGPPMNGQAFNGLIFNLTNPDPFAAAKSNATSLLLLASIFQATSSAPGGLTAAFQTNSFVGMASKIYGAYLCLFAKTVYFLPAQVPISVVVQSFQRRIWLSDIAVHIEAALLVLIALIGGLVQVFHRDSRRHLRLQHIPGTIASAICLGAESNVAQLLDGKQEQNFGQALSDKQFRIDPQTMKIVMENEDGFADAISLRHHHSNST